MDGRRGGSLLVVEDERKIAGFIRQGLEEHGFDVDVSGNGSEAYALATSRPLAVLTISARTELVP